MKIRKKNNMKHKEFPVISIIIPVYNAQDTIYTALESVVNQAYRHLEVIIINDCSSDKTLGVIQDFLPLFENEGIGIQVINHENNRGVAAARNTGLDQATGKFVYYVDADDHIESDTIELLVKEAVSKDADIVGCNWYLTFDKNERKMNQSSFSTPSEAIKKILNGSMRWNLWLFMARRSLYENHQIRFTDGLNMGEDLTVTIKLFVHASSVSYINKALYHYRRSNKESLTQVYSDDHITQVTKNVLEVEKYLLKNNLTNQLGNSLDFLKLNIKLPLLISDQKEQYKRWLSWFPETNDMVMGNKAQPVRTRLIQWLAVQKQFWIIKLYYRVVIQFVYGTLYK